MSAGSIFRHPNPLPVGVDSGHAMTVLGPVPVAKLGVTLTHEHILLDASKKWRPPCTCSQMGFAERPVSQDMLGELRLNPIGNRDNCMLLDVALAIDELMMFRELGGESLVDATNVGVGRDPAALQRISRRTGLNIIMGSGFYLEPSHPDYVREASVEQLAEKIIHDVGGGPEQPAVIAGLIGEIGVSPEFTAEEEKCLRAGARAAARTGVPLSVHLPGWLRLGERVLDITEAEGADPRHTILCHMNPSGEDTDYQHRLARRGVFLGYDMIGIDFFFAEKNTQAPSDEQNAIAIRRLIDAGFLQQILISHDVFLKMMLVRYGGHGYGHILRNFVPRLRRHGVNDEQLETLLIENPRYVFSRRETAAA
ncbi:phosphotriesterase-related protein [Ancylobacter aquaticus]|uniref:Phosphotriesterase-related protein n=1 Tax=Ancylobacter aquaticus TaxID=100 RepID=A0A4R1I583_ANCAQ|nr:phosphotriesterase-related protein [Ancylobacter aquaticus]TCK29173.1 phosphotriesterase-related protein [Ancylobacter aquaticus]